MPFRGPLGTFTGKVSVPDHNVDLARITATSAVLPMNVLQDVVVDLVGIEKRPIIYPVTIIQAGQIVDLAKITATSQVFPVDVVQSVSTDNNVFLEPIQAQSQVFPVSIDFENVVDLEKINATSQVFPVTVELSGIGQISLTTADILAIRNSVWGLLTLSGETTVQALLSANNKSDLGKLGSTGFGGVSAGGRGLYFEPQTIDKLLDEIKKSYKIAEDATKKAGKVSERVIEKQPIYITQPAQIVPRLVAPVVINADEDEEEAVVAAIMALMTEED